MIQRESLADMVRCRISEMLERLGPHRDVALYRRVMSEVERVLIEESLRQAQGSRVEAARILGIHRNTLRLRMQSLLIDGSEYS